MAVFDEVETLDIEMFQDSWWSIQITMTDDDGQPLPPMDDWVGAGQVRLEQSSEDVYAAFGVTCEGNIVTLELQSAGPFRGIYDVFLTPPGSIRVPLLQGSVRVKRSSTR